MELKVIKPFHGKVENKVMNKGDLVHSTDVERINALVGGGFCVIVSLSDTLIGVSLASNVKERGVANALGKLTEEQAQKLAEYLNENDNNITE